MRTAGTSLRRSAAGTSLLDKRVLQKIALGIVACGGSLLLAACSSHIEAPSDGLSHVGGDDSAKVANAQNAVPGEKFNAEDDEIVSRETRTAWQHALAHDERGALPEAAWNKLRVQDEKESMEMLKSLEARFQSASFIKTMMGQVKQHFGKKEEAAAYYEEASLQNRLDPVLIFKAAEMRRKSGGTERALSYYKKVIEIQPDFPGARLGVARCLLADKKTAADGRKMLEDILAKEPQNKDAQAALDESKSK